MKAKCAIALSALFVLAGANAKAEGYADLGGDAAGFAKVVAGKPIEFPRDFGAHPDFRTEWWYITANLKDETGAAFGAQWTLFRSSLEPGPQREGWANQSVWMAHAAVTSATEHLFAQDFARGGVGLAGVEVAPFRAFIDDWSLAAPDAQSEGLSRLDMVARGEGFSYALQLRATGPIVLQGDNGYSRKSDQGQASYYFSQPFFDVDGALAIDGKNFKVTGRAWFDREWTSQYLAADQKGWDWFALHFADGQKAMLFRLRGPAGDDYLAGTWIAADGAAEPLQREDIMLTPLEETAIGDKSLPTRWRVAIKSKGVAIETRPLNPKAWLATRFPYWEGPISFSGAQQGEGYLEMTGY